MREAELASGLPEAHQRFLSKYIEAARQAGVITNARLFERFPQARLFAAYKDEPKNRATLLAANSKMPFEIAEHLDVAGCLQVFNIALEKLGEATPDKVFGVVTADELVRLFPADELFAFVEETKWDEQDRAPHRDLARDALHAFKVEELGGGPTRTLHAIEDAIGIGLYVVHLPKSALVQIIQTARDLADGKVPPGKVPFTVDAMAEAAPIDLLAQHLPLPVLMKPVRAVAEQFGFVKKPEPVVPPPPPTTLAPSGDGDDEKVPTIPPPAKRPDTEDGEPEVSIEPAAASPSGAPDAPLDEDDAALAAMLADDAKRKAGADAGGKALRLDGVDDEDEDAKTTVGTVPVPPPPGGKKDPPPLPGVAGKGQQGGQPRKR